MRKKINRHSLILTIAFAAASLSPAVYFLIPLYLKDIGINESQIGLIFGLPIFVSFLISIPIGLSNDRFHSRIFISIGLFLSGVMHMFLGYSTNFYLILFLFILHGMGTNFQNISLDSFILKLKDNINQIYLGGLGVFAGLSKIIIGILFILITLVFAFKTIAVLYFLLALLALNLPKAETFKFEISDYKRDFLNKKSIIFMGIMFLFFLHFGPENVNYSLFLKNVFHLTMTEMSIYMGVPIIFLGISSYFFGKKLKQGYLSYKVLLWGMLLNGLGHIIQIIPILYISFLGRFIHEIGDGAVFMFMFNGLSILFPKERIGGNASLLTVVKVFAVLISSVSAGFIADQYGHSVPFVIAGVACLAATQLAYMYRDVLTH